VRVARQHEVALALRRIQERGLQFVQAPVGGVEGVADPELDVGNDLIVTAAAGVQLAAYVAEALDEGALDVRVDVFQLDVEREFAAINLRGDVVQRGDDLVRFVGGEEADLGEHAGVGLAGADVVAVEAAVD